MGPFRLWPIETTNNGKRKNQGEETRRAARRSTSNSTVVGHAVLFALSPAVTSYVAPETIRAASEARNTTTGATSAGSIHGTPSGDFALSASFAASSSFWTSPVGVFAPT